MNDMNERNGEESTVFERIGVARVINAVGPATRLGGLPLHHTVIEAMAQATRHPVRMDQLETAAGRHAARLLGVEAAYITSGAAAALTLATATAIAGSDAAKIDALPRISGDPHRVVVLAAHRDPYDRSIEAAGAELAVVGYPGSTHIGEVTRAMDDGAVAVLYRPGRAGNHPSLGEIASAARSRGIPVIVDGALYAPPLSNLHRWMEDGASLIALSGGKHLRGPQSSGLLCGTAEFIDLVALHHQDMDERESTWSLRSDDDSVRTPPRHGVGRAMKVGREQIAGLLAAVERYVEAPGRDDGDGIRELERLRVLLDTGPLTAVWHDTSVLAVPVIELDLSASGIDVDAFVNALADRSPAIYVEESEAWRGIVTINPMALREGDATELAAAFAEVTSHLGRQNEKESEK